MELSEHDKQMLAVADAGDPNDPAENKPAESKLPSEEPPKDEQEEASEKPNEYELPEGFDSVEELIEFYNNIPDEEDETPADGDETEEESEELTTLREAARERAVYDEVGGAEKYKELAEWAHENADPAQLEVYNDAVTKGSPEVAAFAAKALSAMHELATLKAHGQQGDLTFPGQTNQMSPGIKPYESDAQMTQDMNDPRYRNDPAFRAKVERKIAASL